MSDLERLKQYILEANFPTFTDIELQTLIELNGGDVGLAAYDACMQKALDDSISLGPIKINSNEKFWLRRASMVKALEYKYQKGIGGKGSKSFSARRYDD